ncbi:lymphotoxin-alpha [Seriola aureovittata]|uniref:lymphotoxin-alpha n=1 Tax=Seriola aureovittata TaxID=2871759 RepID=UPI0024BDD6F1|nr:lymphotoxin-alpha [Seriola aureovittata]
MEGQSRSSHKYLLLQVWCGLLTVAMVVMAAFLTSVKPKSAEDGVPTLKPDNISSTINPSLAPMKLVGSSLSYIQLIKSLDKSSWEVSPGCHSCFLSLRNDSIHCMKSSLYFIYAQVTFANLPSKTQTRSVILKRNPRAGKRMKKLVEGTFPNTSEVSVWVAKIVKLNEGDSISLDLTDEVLNDNTFWGAYQLH